MKRSFFAPRNEKVAVFLLITHFFASLGFSVECFCSLQTSEHCTSCAVHGGCEQTTGSSDYKNDVENSHLFKNLRRHVGGQTGKNRPLITATTRNSVSSCHLIVLPYEPFLRAHQGESYHYCRHYCIHMKQSD